MSNKHEPHHRPQGAGLLADMKSIPIGRLQFEGMIEIPGRLTSQGLIAEPNIEGTRNRKRWRMHYLPQLRHVQLDYYGPNTDKVESFFIHETLIAWWTPA